MPEQLTANGVDLNGLVSNVEDIASLLRTPKRRGDNIAVPGRHGMLRVPNKLFDQNEIVLPMWVVGVDPQSGATLNGLSPEAVNAFYQRVDLLNRIFNSDVVTLEHTLADGTVRRAYAEINDVMDWTRQLGSPLFGSVSVALRIPGAFWVDTSDTTVSWTVTSGTHRVLSEFAAATAPMDELTITFGPSNNPEISQPAGGVYMAYDGVIASGRKLVVNTANWTLSPGDGTAWTPSFGVFRHGGAAGRWFQLVPEITGPDVIFVHTGGGTAQITVSGPRKYLNG